MTKRRVADLQPMTNENFQLGIAVCKMHGNFKLMDEIYNDFREMTKTVEIIEKRVSNFNLPVDKSGIIALCLLGNYRPGFVILALIEALEDRLELGYPTITVGTLFGITFPDGFYNDKKASELCDKRRFERSGQFDYLY